jgi:hypothetical protein
MKLRCLTPNTYIHVSVCDLYIPTIGYTVKKGYRLTRPQPQMSLTKLSLCRNN